jgi:tripartite-type tricarboxylate transporter receptor subunit TctC
MPGDGFTRRVIAFGALGSFVLPMAAAAAQDAYPSRPVDVIVPFAAGGGTDLIARLLCDGLTRRLGNSFVAINRPGANTNIGTQAVVRSKPDGYSLLMASIGLAANPSLYRKLSYDPQRDLVPITLIANSSAVVVVHPSLPVHDVPGLISYLKARPNQINYAAYGIGSGPHLSAELFQAATGTSLVHVPYKGGGDAAVAVLTNQVQMFFSGPMPVLAMIRDGALRPIAVAADRRLNLLPDVPTFREFGIDYLSGTWFGLLAPAGTDPSILKRLHAAAIETLDEPIVRSRLSETGAEVIASTPDEFKRFLKDETDRLSVRIKAAGLRID